LDSTNYGNDLTHNAIVLEDNNGILGKIFKVAMGWSWNMIDGSFNFKSCHEIENNSNWFVILSLSLSLFSQLR
jgi:hypothetical protein